MRLALVLALAACHAATPGTAGTEYRNGHWFDGERFVDKTMWVVGDTFAETPPARITRTVDLAGKFVVPPYAEGHNHWLEPKLVDAYVATYLRDGIFYVRDMSTPFHDAIRPHVNTPTSVDYIAAHQGFTGPGGHPIELFEMLAKMGVVPAAWMDTHGEGNAVYVVSSEQDVDRDWPKLMATKPDFIKLFLVHSDEYATRLTSAPVGKRGLDPALVPGIVRRAHAAHLRVAAHIEDAADFHVAVAGGVDDIAHMPFVAADHPETYRIDPADLAAAAKRHVSVATTLDWMADDGTTDAQRAVVRDNFAAMRAAGTTIVIGTDLFRKTAATEVDLIAAQHLMSNLELLQAWSITTPQVIFPDRKIGRLATGYEASFLVLGSDPLADPAHLHDITARVKQGRDLVPTAATLPPLD
jgi:hypothetical protein